MIRTRYGKAAFTLIELMVVMAILGVFLIMTAIVSRGAIDINSRTKSRIASERAAAAFLQQFRLDLETRPDRREAQPRIDKHEGNDDFTLLTQRQGYALHSGVANRFTALTGYRIRDHQLERATSGYGFGAGAERPAESSGTLSLSNFADDGAARLPDSAFHRMVPDILRIEFSFVVGDGEKSIIKAAPPADTADLRAVVATIVTLDSDRRRELDDAKLKSIAGEFSDAVDNELPMDAWSQTAAHLSDKLPSLPKSALGQVRVHQGVFRWNPAGILP